MGKEERSVQGLLPLRQDEWAASLKHKLISPTLSGLPAAHPEHVLPMTSGFSDGPIMRTFMAAQEAQRDPKAVSIAMGVAEPPDDPPL